jgi:hypothetical protein
MPAHEPDEFEQRARRAAEAQEIRREYHRECGGRALRAFLLAACGVLAMWAAWKMATSDAYEHNPVVRELRERAPW